MGRAQIRKLNKAVGRGARGDASSEVRANARELVVQLLGRSLQWQHRNLAIRRLELAVEVGAQIPDDMITACSNLIEMSGSASLRFRLAKAVRLAGEAQERTQGVDA